jgi:hypothetical protein
MKIPKLGTDTKMIIAGVLVLGVGAWYVQRQVRAAADGLVQGVGNSFDNIYSSLAGGLGGAWDSVGDTFNSVGTSIRSGGDAVASALGVQGTIDPVTGGYVPYGALPNAPPDKPYNVPWYLGGGHSDIFSADGTYLGPGVWGSTSARQAEQADVRRLDNSIADGTYRAPGAFSYLFPNYATL